MTFGAATAEQVQTHQVPAITSDLLAHSGVSHAFFTRAGGVSTGVYATLNGGTGSNDDPASVAENRARMAGVLGVAASHLMVPFQIHSATAIEVDAPWAQVQRPRVDGVVTRTRGIGIGVTGADCGVLLFSDARHGVIGAAHAGWKGALTGIVEATLDLMERCGAKRADTHVVLGPTIGPRSYEVGAEFVERFVATSADYRRFFSASEREGHAMFDLPGFIGMRLERASVGRFENLGLDTYAEETLFYSYRRMTHKGEADYGRLVAAIALA